MMSTGFGYRRTRVIFLTAGSMAFAVVAPAPAHGATAAQTRRELRAEVALLRSDGGVVRCGLYRSEDGFPKDPNKTSAFVVVAPHARRATCVFG